MSLCVVAKSKKYKPLERGGKKGAVDKAPIECNIKWLEKYTVLLILTNGQVGFNNCFSILATKLFHIQARSRFSLLDKLLDGVRRNNF